MQEGINFGGNEENNLEQSKELLRQEREAFINAATTGEIIIQQVGFQNKSDKDGNLSLQILADGLIAQGAIKSISELNVRYVRPQDFENDPEAQKAAIILDMGNTGLEIKEGQWRFDHHTEEAGEPTSASRLLTEWMREHEFWKDTPEEERVEKNQILAVTDAMDNKSYLGPNFKISRNAIGLQYAQNRDGETLSDIGSNRRFHPEWMALMVASGPEGGKVEDVDPNLELSDEQIRDLGIENTVAIFEENLAKYREEFPKLEEQGWIQTTPEGNKVLIDVNGTLSQKFKGIDLVDLAYEFGVHNVIKYWEEGQSKQGPYRGAFISSQHGELNLKHLQDNFEDSKVVRGKMFVYNELDPMGPKLKDLFDQFDLTRANLPEDMEKVLVAESLTFEDEIIQLHKDHRPHVKFTPEDYQPKPEDKDLRRFFKKDFWKDKFNLGTKSEKEARDEEKKLKQLADLEKTYNSGIDHALMGREKGKEGDLVKLQMLKAHIEAIEPDPQKAEREYNLQAYAYVQDLKRNYLAQDIRDSLYAADAAEAISVDRAPWVELVEMHSENITKIERNILPDLQLEYKVTEKKPAATTEQETQKSRELDQLKQKIGGFQQNLDRERKLREDALDKSYIYGSHIAMYKDEAAEVMDLVKEHELLDYELDYEGTHLRTDMLAQMDYFDRQKEFCLELNKEYAEAINNDPALANDLAVIQRRLLKNHNDLSTLDLVPSWHRAATRLIEIKDSMAKDFRKYQEKVINAGIQKLND